MLHVGPAGQRNQRLMVHALLDLSLRLLLSPANPAGATRTNVGTWLTNVGTRLPNVGTRRTNVEMSPESPMSQQCPMKREKKKKDDT